VNIDLKGKFLVVIKPDVHVSTAEAYSGIVPRESHLDIGNIPLEDWKLFVKNDFEETIFRKFPVIRSIKEDLYKAGAVYAAMSGSGSAVYGIFSEKTGHEKISAHSPAFSSWL